MYSAILWFIGLSEEEVKEYYEKGKVIIYAQIYKYEKKYQMHYNIRFTFV